MMISSKTGRVTTPGPKRTEFPQHLFWDPIPLCLMVIVTSVVFGVNNVRLGPLALFCNFCCVIKNLLL